MKENQLIKTYGLSKDIMREFRDSCSYVEGVDWERIPSKRPQKIWEIQWTDAGILNLKATLGLRDPEPVKERQMLRGKVKSKYQNNARLLKVELPDGRFVNVLVKSTEKFAIGMAIDCLQDKERWVARRMPRFYGKY